MPSFLNFDSLTLVKMMLALFMTMVTGLLTPVYIDNKEFFMNGSNIASLPYDDVYTAFKLPVAINSTVIDGFDWRQPYPGSHIDGHAAYLEISQDVPVPSSIVENSTTVLTSLTFELPENMRSEGQSQAMDPSWYICRHIFISTKTDAKQAVDGGQKCNFLSQQCQLDLKTSLTETWGKEAENTMCAALSFDPMPESCQESFGFVRQVVMAFDADHIADPLTRSAQTDKSQSQYSWRIGTGYHAPGDAKAYVLAANRTYLVANVWGYSQNSSSKQPPEVSFACLSSGNIHDPSPPAPPSSSTTTTSSTTTSSTPTWTPIPNNVTFRDDFSSRSMDNWEIFGGRFEAAAGFMLADNSLGGKAILNTNFGDFVFDADVMLLSTSGNAGLIFRVSNPTSGIDGYNGYYAGIDASGSIFIGRAHGDWTELGRSPADVAAEQYHHIKVLAIYETILVFIDDIKQPKITATDSEYSSGMNGVRVFGTLAAFDNIVITPLSQAASIISGLILDEKIASQDHRSIPALRGISRNERPGQHPCHKISQSFPLSPLPFRCRGTRPRELTHGPRLRQKRSPCDLQAFLGHVTITGNQKTRLPDGRQIWTEVPDFDKMDWARLGEGADIGAFVEEYTKAGSIGKYSNERTFRDWNLPNPRYADVMRKSMEIFDTAKATIEATGRSVPTHLIDGMKEALITQANAREVDKALMTRQKFENYIAQYFPHWQPPLSDYVQRPHVDGYQAVDMFRTAGYLQQMVGVEQSRQILMSWDQYNNRASNVDGHDKAIIQTHKMHEHIAGACAARRA